MTVIDVALEVIDDNPYQARSSYSTKKVDELAYSIRENGLRQTPDARPADGRYQLAYGHYRKRAFKKLAKEDPKRWGTMPLDVKDIADRDMAIFALEENLRRDDITPLDVARSVEMYLTTFPDETETGLAKRLNQTQGNIANMRRVLKCPLEVLEKVNEGVINFTMARELLIFQSLDAGTYEEWSSKEGRSVKKQKDETYLMKSAIKGLKTGSSQYGNPCTVEGIKRSIDDVAASDFRHLEKGGSYNTAGDPLFDTRAAGCLKCPKMLRTYRTQTEARHFCTDFQCWDAKQEEHKKQQATEAKKRMEEDIARRVAEAETARRKGISQEIPPGTVQPVDDTDRWMEEQAKVLEEQADARDRQLDEQAEMEAVEGLEGEEGIEAEEISKDLPRFTTLEDVCHGCLNQSACDGTPRLAVSDDVDQRDLFVCPERVTKETMPQLRQRAAGTRAEVLDLRELRLNRYSGDLKAGYVLLNSGWSEPLKVMDGPEECTERCTRGFHYAFDSSETGGNVYFVCTDPKCVAKKKAAFTRAKNAAGTARKKSEMAAIRQAVDNTTILDKPRMNLLLEAQIRGRHARSSYRGGEQAETYLAKLLDLKRPEGYDSNWEKNRYKLFREAMSPLSEEELAKIIVEFCLMMLTYDGDIQEYQIQTTEVLNSMGVGVTTEKKGPEDG